MDTRPASIALGTVLGARYRLERFIGEGAFGAVFRATSLVDGRPAAVKVISAEALSRTGGLGRFRREAELVGRLTHPNTVRLFDVGEDAGGWLFMAFELLDGQSIDKLIEREGPMDPLRVGRLALEVLAALEEAHAMGVVHRDLKPANLFLVYANFGEGVKVLDFGLAKSTNPGTLEGLTQDGTTVGTPIYMAPEQIMGQAVTPRSDVFSLGVVIDEMIEGRPLYDVQAPALRLMTERISGVRVPIPPRVAGSVLGPIVARATSLDASARYGSAAEMKEAIARVLADSGRIVVGSARSIVDEPTADPYQAGALPPRNLAFVASATVAAPTPASGQRATAQPSSPPYSPPTVPQAPAPSPPPAWPAGPRPSHSAAAPPGLSSAPATLASRGGAPANSKAKLTMALGLVLAIGTVIALAVAFLVVSRPEPRASTREKPARKKERSDPMHTPPVRSTRALDAPTLPAPPVPPIPSVSGSVDYIADPEAFMQLLTKSHPSLRAHWFMFGRGYAQAEVETSGGAHLERAADGKLVDAGPAAHATQAKPIMLEAFDARAITKVSLDAAKRISSPGAQTELVLVTASPVTGIPNFAVNVRDHDGTMHTVIYDSQGTFVGDAN